MGGATVAAFSVCPGGRRVAEVVDSGSGYVVTIRDLPTLRFVRRQPVTAVHAEEIACVNESGDQLAVFFSDTAARGRLTRVTPRSATTIWRGKAFHMSFWKHLAYAQVLHRAGTTLVAVDLRNGGAKKLGTVPVAGAYQLVPNSAGTRLAGDAFEEGCRIRCYRFVLIDVERRPIAARTILLPTQCCGLARWLRDGRIAYVRGERILVYDAALRRSARVSGWSAISTAVLGSRLVGVGRFGKLLRVELPSGRIDVVRRLPGEPNVIVSARG
jgi:hypothetical protein